MRADLAQRLSAAVIVVPPLVDRTEDIPILVRHFLERRRASPVVDDETMEMLCSYWWPGNVRELRNVVEFAIAMGGLSKTFYRWMHETQVPPTRRGRRR